MKLSEAADNFLKHNAPGWHEKFKTDYWIMELCCPSRCLLGEIHAYTGVYMREDGLGECSECHHLAFDIYKCYYRSQCQPIPMSQAIERIADHIKKCHPSIMKQERPIEA